jgi:polysaccharide export outer membrane protein
MNKVRSRSTFAGLVFFFATIMSGQQLSSRNPAYRLQCSDVLEIRYLYTPEFNQEVTIRPDGGISIAGIGGLIAAGLTLDRVTTDIVALSKQRLNDPVVTVLLKEFQKPYIFVGGEVMNPGRFELRGDVTAIEAISLAGGFKNSSKHSQVLLLRRIDNDRAETKLLDLKKLIASRKLEEDVDLRSGDMLYVPQNTLSKVEHIVHWGQFGMLYNPIR